MVDPVESGGWLFGSAGLIAAVGTFMSARRKDKRDDRIDPVALVTDANRAAYDALQGTITRLESGVANLSQELASTKASLDRTNQKLAEVQADLLVTKTENRVLRAKVVDLTRLLSEHRTG